MFVLLVQGQGGLYTATALRDRGYDVAFIEKQSHAGGHATTYWPPGGHDPIDIGVRIHPDTQMVRDVYGRYGLSVERIDLKQDKVLCANFNK